jgi:hypothetical protein
VSGWRLWEIHSGGDFTQPPVLPLGGAESWAPGEEGRPCHRTWDQQPKPVSTAGREAVARGPKPITPGTAVLLGMRVLARLSSSQRAMITGDESCVPHVWPLPPSSLEGLIPEPAREVVLA